MSNPKDDPTFPYPDDKEVMKGNRYHIEPFRKLPEPKGGFSKTALVLDVVNQLRKTKQFFRISIPIFFIAPCSMLEFISLYFTPTDDLLSVSKCKDAEERFLRVTKWAMCNIPRMMSPNGFCHSKPYNPIIGEKHVWKWKHKDGSTSYCIAEQVSHHPPISSFYISNRKNNFSIRSTVYPITKLYPNSFMLKMIGEINFRIHTTGEEFQLEFPPVLCYGLLFGRQFIEHNGNYNITCEKSGYSTSLKFYEKDKNKLAGRIVHKESKDPLYKVSGYADKKIVIRNCKTKKTTLFCDNTNKEFLNIIQLCRPIKDMEQHESRRNWHMVTKSLKEKKLDNAHTYKNGIENVQRAKRKVRKEKKIVFKPKYFKLLKEEEVSKDSLEKVQIFESIFDNVEVYKDGEEDVFETHEMFKAI